MSILDKFDHKSTLEAPLPFKVKASFHAMFEHWQSLAEGDDPDQAKYAQTVLDSVAHAKEIHVPFDDFTLLDKYEDEIARLFAPLFPEPLHNNEIKAISLPFRHFFFNPTPRLKDILDQTDQDYMMMIRDLEPDQMYVFACMFVIKVLYRTNVEYKRPFFFDIPNKKDGVRKNYRAFFNGDFATFKANDEARKLTDDDIKELVDNFDNVELWMEKIPPDSYDFEGFGLVTLFDVTTDESLSSMKNILLKPAALRSTALVRSLEEDLRSYFGEKDIDLSFATYDQASHNIMKMNSSAWANADGDCEECDWSSTTSENNFCDRSEELVFAKKQMFVLSDIAKLKAYSNPLLERMRAHGVQSMIVCPLEYENSVIGYLELTSSTPYLLNSVMANKLRDVTPLFTVAMKRALDEHETKLEAIVQEKFTSIHSSVSWRFTEVAEKVLKGRENQLGDQMEQVVFRDVVPLYGQFDIRGSSDARNSAIQADLVKQLKQAENVMAAALNNVHLPVYDQLKYRIENYRTNLEQNVSAGDEVKILDFLQKEIYPVFHHLSAQDPALQKTIASYMMALDPELNVIYDKRKNYEDSVMMINESIGDVVDAEQDSAQQMFPHYFEKYKTDGVEYNAYIGQSLLQNLTYDPIYLHNMRLWQLLLTHRVEQRMHALRAKLPVPLEIASLILVHSAPLAIKFRLDEKKFDVDGAYNIRYEIVKKRIDKAHIKGTTERLTQPGKIAIVYSQDDEADEYMRYLEYMGSLGMIDGDIENVELQDLQGTAGLRALRATVSYSGAHVDADNLEKAIQEIND